MNMSTLPRRTYLRLMVALSHFTAIRAVALPLMLVLSLAACSSVKAGQTGVKTGPSGKVTACGLGQGYHMTGFGSMHTFTNKLTYSYMTANPKEGDKDGPDDVAVTSKEGADMRADLQIGYTLQGDKDTVCRIYNTLAKDDAQVRDLIVRPAVRAAAPDVFSQYNAKDAKTGKRSEIAEKIRTSLNDRFSKEPLKGFVVAQTVQVGDVRLPANIQQNVDNAIKAEADNVTAEKERQSKLTRAETDLQESETKAKQRAIDAAAQADANRQEAASLTPELAALKAQQACADAIAKTQAQVVNCGNNANSPDVIVNPRTK